MTAKRLPQARRAQRSEKLNPPKKNGCCTAGPARTLTHFPSSGGFWVRSMRTADDTCEFANVRVCVWRAQVLGAWCSAACVHVGKRANGARA